MVAALPRIGYERMFRFADPLNYTPARSDALDAIAAREGRTPQEVAYDMLIEDGGPISSWPASSTMPTTTSTA